MEDFRIIYRILKLLQQSMDFEDFDEKGRCHCEGHQGNCARHLIATEPRCTRTVVFFCPFLSTVQNLPSAFFMPF